jgi:UDP-glucose 6-dehydrogenase
MQRAFFKLNIIHNPEFLREATAEKDFENQSTVLLSGKNLRRVMDAYSLCLPGILFETSDNYSDTELAKYIHNCFLAMKVIFMSELFAYQNKHPAFKAGQDLHRARKMAASQGGIGFTHLDTPASDGRLGFGGMCFPKDLRAFLQHQGDSCKAVSSLLHITQMINQQARPELYEKKRPIHLQKK